MCSFFFCEFLLLPLTYWSWLIYLMSLCFISSVKDEFLSMQNVRGVIVEYFQNLTQKVLHEAGNFILIVAENIFSIREHAVGFFKHLIYAISISFVLILHDITWKWRSPSALKKSNQPTKKTTQAGFPRLITYNLNL